MWTNTKCPTHISSNVENSKVHLVDWLHAKALFLTCFFRSERHPSFLYIRNFMLFGYGYGTYESFQNMPFKVLAKTTFIFNPGSSLAICIWLLVVFNKNPRTHSNWTSEDHVVIQVESKSHSSQSQSRTSDALLPFQMTKDPTHLLVDYVFVAAPGDYFDKPSATYKSKRRTESNIIAK